MKSRTTTSSSTVAMTAVVAALRSGARPPGTAIASSETI
jgi:hypothetical protein